MNVIGIALEELYRIFRILNHDKFDNELPEPVITIQKTSGRSLGHFTVDKVWRNKQNVEDNNIAVDENDEAAYYEINIDPRWFYKCTAEEIVDTLLHEMVHYRNKVADIKDCNGQNHNKNFKSLAESVGLVVEKGAGVGWGYTSLSDELRVYIAEEIKPNEEAFEYFRTGTIKAVKPRKKTTFKYTCPDCGLIAKGKRDIPIKCGACDVVMEMEDDPDNESDDSDN